MFCVSRSISTLVAQSGNEAFQAAACRAASTDLNSLKDAIHVSPFAAAINCLASSCSINHCL